MNRIPLYPDSLSGYNYASLGPKEDEKCYIKEIHGPFRLIRFMTDKYLLIMIL